MKPADVPAFCEHWPQCGCDAGCGFALPCRTAGRWRGRIAFAGACLAPSAFAAFLFLTR